MISCPITIKIQSEMVKVIVSIYMYQLVKTFHPARQKLGTFYNDSTWSKTPITINTTYVHAVDGEPSQKLI